MYEAHSLGRTIRLYLWNFYDGVNIKHTITKIISSNSKYLIFHMGYLIDTKFTGAVF